MGPVLDVLPYVVLSVLIPVSLCALTHPAALADRAARLRRHPPAPFSRPIEDVVADVRRLGSRFHARQVSYVKAEGLARAYDAVLSEGCHALGIDHLLGVLPPGAERARERERVERLLHRWGVDLSAIDDAA